MAKQRYDESWKGVIGYPDYEVSDCGRVRSKERVSIQKNHWSGDTKKCILKARILKGVRRDSGYIQVSLYKGKKQRTENVHVLVARAFIGPCPKGKEVRHLDGDPSHNEKINLKYGTPKKNGADKIKHGRSLRGEKNVQTKLTITDVRYIRRVYQPRHPKYSTFALGKKFGVHPTNIGCIVRGETWAYVEQGR